MITALLLVRLPIVLGFAGSFRRIERSSFQTPCGMTQNPFSSMIGDMASSLFKNGLSNGGSLQRNPSIDEAMARLATPAWSDIKSKLENLQTPEERKFREEVAQGYRASPLNKIRLYDESNKEKDIRVVFYRDSASWCPYCQKVWLTLEEKKIPYKVEKINMRCYGEKPASFRLVQPGGQIPVAVIDGTTFGQSNDIIFALENFFPSHKSLKNPPNKSEESQRLFRLERELFSVWMYWLTGNGGDRSKRSFVSVLNEVESSLKKTKGPFFFGEEITLNDIMFVPFLERMCASLLFFKGFMIRGQNTGYPAINAWFDALETLPSYQLTKSDYYTHCWDLPPQLGGCTYEPAGKPYEDAINGLRSIDGTQGSWELPLQPDLGGIEPDWTWAGDESAAQREAVERLSTNNQDIVKFACRGAGEKGIPRYMAVLSDPNAKPNQAVESSVDSLLRVVALAILDGTDAHQSLLKEVSIAVASEGGQEFSSGVIASLAYLRDRVGVPRDMQLPAARQLRAHINWAIGGLLEVAEN